MSNIEVPNDIKLNTPFKIERGGRKATYKIIIHPEVKGWFALVANHEFLYERSPMRDNKNIINAGNTLNEAYICAYYHT